MSWTSEFGPAPPRPDLRNQEAELPTDDTEDDGKGPLDPSVFDGLFDDLDDAEDSEDSEDSDVDAPSLVDDTTADEAQPDGAIDIEDEDFNPSTTVQIGSPGPSTTSDVDATVDAETDQGHDLDQVGFDDLLDEPTDDETGNDDQPLGQADDVEATAAETTAEVDVDIDPGDPDRTGDSDHAEDLDDADEAPSDEQHDAEEDTVLTVVENAGPEADQGEQVPADEPVASIGAIGAVFEPLSADQLEPEPTHDEVESIGDQGPGLYIVPNDEPVADDGPEADPILDPDPYPQTEDDHADEPEVSSLFTLAPDEPEPPEEIQRPTPVPAIIFDDPVPPAAEVLIPTEIHDRPAHLADPSFAVQQHQPMARAVLAPTRRRWPAFAGAIALGGLFGVVAALILTQAFGGDEEPGTPPQAVEADVDGDQASVSATQVQPSAPNPLVVDGRLTFHDLAFAPGTAELTQASQDRLAALAQALSGLDPGPATVSVRTFGGATAQADRDLSVLQAQALADSLVALGVQFDQISVVGRGAAPLTESLPVDNFIVIGSGLRASALAPVVDGLSPFAVGIDEQSGALRPESQRVLDQVGVLMAATDEGSISLAGYAFSQAGGPANKALAEQATMAAKQYLVETYGISPDRVSTVTPGSLPFVVGSSVHTHVQVAWGSAATTAVAVAQLDRAALTFGPGSDQVSPAAAAELDRLAAIIADTSAEAVIHIRTATEPTPSANAQLSSRQAAAVTEYLTGTGLTGGQVRVFGGGDVTRLRSDSLASELTITVLP